MKWTGLPAAALAASAAFALLATALPAAAADSCRNACNNSYGSCQRSAKAAPVAERACLANWGTCKSKCKRTTSSISTKTTTTAAKSTVAQR